TRALVIAGRLREAIATADEAEALGRDRPELASESGLSPYGLLLVQRGNALVYLGHPADGARAMEQATELARERRDIGLLGFAPVCHVVACDLLGEAEQALVPARRAVEAAEAGRSPAPRALGHAYVANGRWAEAMEALTTVAAEFGDNVTPLVESDTAALLAEAQLGIGDVAGALATAERAIDVARRLHRPLAEIRARLARARALLATDRGE